MSRKKDKQKYSIRALKLSGLLILRVVFLFAVAITLVSLPGPLASTLQLPGVQVARASLAPATNWLPAGSSTNTEIQAIFSGDVTEQNAFLSGQVDISDIPLTPQQVQCLSQSGSSCSGFPGVNPSGFAVTSPISTHDIFEIQIMEHNNYWGVPFNFGFDGNVAGSTCLITSATGIGLSDAACPGVSIRQAIAHLIDKNSFCANNGIVVCSAADNDVPVSDGLIAPDPCSWDQLGTISVLATTVSTIQSGANCHVGAPGGTAFHLGSTTGVGHDTTSTAASYPWEPATDNGGAADLCAAAAHISLALTGSATNYNPSTCVLTLTAAQLTAAEAHPVNVLARSDRPARLRLGDGLAEDLCYLFTGHFPVNGVASPLCQQIPTTTTACTGACVVTETRGPFALFFPCPRSPCNVDSWWLYTGGFGGVFPFDSLLYGQFNSQFVSGVGAFDQPPCSSLAVPTTSPTNYQYTCVPAYDTISSEMEFSPCPSAPGDPSGTQSVETGPPVTFANCSETTMLSAVSAGYQAQDMLGKLAMWIPIYNPTEQFGYLANWNNVINSQGAGVANFFTWLDANSAGTTTVTQGVAAPTKSLNPYAASTFADFEAIGVLYDSIGILNPLNNNQYFDYLANGHSTPCNTNVGSQCDLAHLGYTPPLGTVATIRFSLRPDIFWQSDSVGTGHPARPLTSYDVKFTYLTCKAVGSFQCGVLSPLVDIHVLDKATFDLNLNAIGPFTLFNITSPTIIPGRYWSSTCQGATWDADLAAGAVPDSCMAVTSAMSTITFDPIASVPNNGASTGILIGSSLFECQSSAGVVGYGCSSSGAENPPGGGSYTMTRFGCNRATGTCNAPAANPSTTYFRSAGTLSLAIWSGSNSFPTHDLVVVSSVANCFQKPVGTLGCTRWQRGIGNPGSGSIVDIPQVSAVIRAAQDGNWVYPFNWLPGIPESCCPFIGGPPDGIQSATPVLVEGTVTLNPCSIDPTNGYDC